MNVVITIGTGNSGCGAIHDFLLKNTEYESPFLGEEFRLIDDPDGIINLYYNFFRINSINNPSNAIMRFKNYINNLTNHTAKIDGKNFRIYNKKIIPLSNDYINSITDLNYIASPQFIQIQKSFFDKILIKLKKKFLKSQLNDSLFKMYFPSAEKIFWQNTKKYLYKVFKIQMKNNFSNKIILDQSFNMFNFIDAFKYFDNLKIILITRDPRSIFNSMRNNQSKAYPNQDIALWVKWYDQIIKKFNSYKKKIPFKFKKKILEVKFENFVKDYQKEQKKILNFINTKKIYNDYDFKKTKFNAYKAKKQLSTYEKKFIEKKLSKYLQW